MFNMFHNDTLYTFAPEYKWEISIIWNKKGAND